MVNINKLKGKIVELGTNAGEVAECINMDRATFYRRMSDGGRTFTVGEVEKIIHVLNLTNSEVMAIFFAENVAPNANLKRADEIA